MSRDCCVALPHDATGLSAVCDCGISLSYSLTIFTLKDCIKCGPEVCTKRKTKSNVKYVYNSVKMQIFPVTTGQQKYLNDKIDYLMV